MQSTNYHAGRISAKLKEQNVDETSQEVFFDPVTISVVTTILLQIIKLIKHCTANGEEAVEVAHNPSHANKRQLKVAVRRQLGWWKYWREGDKYMEAILDEGKTLTKQDMLGLYTDEEENAVYIEK